MAQQSRSGKGLRLHQWGALWGQKCPWGARGNGGCCWGADHPPSRKRSGIIFLQTTISIANSLDSISSTGMGSAAIGSLTGMFSAWLWNTRSTEPSLAGSRDPFLTCQGLSLRASKSVNPLGRKPRRRTSM